MLRVIIIIILLLLAAAAAAAVVVVVGSGVRGSVLGARRPIHPNVCLFSGKYTAAHGALSTYFYIVCATERYNDTWFG